ncbi:MAG TPA: serine hydrolase domain-containing protein [Acidimicrobiales bacterium]|nr:serine hydrolase domain-containing protein [Acidimicrobiales bacterium]
MTPAALEGVSSWDAVAAAGFVAGREVQTAGPAGQVFEWASVTKLVTALAVWVAVEEGIAGYDDPAGPPGSTLRHLLAHASGLAPDADDVLAPPGRRRIYSNRGVELAAQHVAAAAAMPFEDYAREAVLEPLGMKATRLVQPAWGAAGPLEDLLRLASELQAPTLVAPATLAASSSPAFPGLPGVLPGFGPQPDNSWGLGVEIRDHKQPHWTGRLNSPRTFGHFGRSGSFLWVDPEAGVAAASLADRPFGPWAAQAWPELSDAVLRSQGP